MDPSKLSTLAGCADLAFCDPIVITRDRIVIDGYARWELAIRMARPMLDCMECDLSLEEALEAFIRAHRPSSGLTDFVRIELALDLELHFQERALMNQQAGGQRKGSSKLTKAQRVDTRQEIARLAGASSGNVSKVKSILTHACSTLLEAARTREVSINLAEKWCKEPAPQQQENLRLLRIKRGLKRKARHLVAAHLSRVSLTTRNRRVMKLPDLVRLLNQLATSAAERPIDAGSIEVEVVGASGRTIFVTEELIHSLTSLQEALSR